MKSSTLTSNRGSTLMMVLVGFTAMGITLGVMNNYVGMFNKMRKNSADKMGARVVVSSALAQMSHLLKLGVVIEPDSLAIKDPQPTDVNVWAADNYNLARVIMPTQQLPYVNQSLTPARPSTDTSILLKTVSFTTASLKNLPTTNPLRYVMQQVSGIESVTFTLERLDDRVNYPASEATVFVRITAVVNAESGVNFFSNRALLRGESIVGISPRELNQFAFMGGILDADTAAGTAPTQAGQLVFGSVTSETGMGAGVQFYGKTIFNEIRLPRSGRFSTVGFGEQVTTYTPPKRVAAGSSALVPFRPETAGGPGSYLVSEIPGIAFRQGIKMDTPDPGLEILFGMTPSTPASSTVCSEYAKSFLDVDATEDTSFAVSNISSQPSTKNADQDISSHYRLAWDGYNAIMDQTSSVRGVECTNGNPVSAISGTADTSDHRCSGDPRVDLVTWQPDNGALPSLKVEVVLTRGMTMPTILNWRASRGDSILFSFAQEALDTVAAKDAEITALDASIAAAQTRKTELEGLVSGGKAALEAAVVTATALVESRTTEKANALAAWEADRPNQALHDAYDAANDALNTAQTDLAAASNAVANFDTLTGELATVSATLASAQADKTAAEAERAAAQQIVDNPPKLALTTTPWTAGSSADIQMGQMKLDVATSNWKNAGFRVTVRVSSGEKGSDGVFGSVRPSGHPVRANLVTLNYTYNSGMGLTSPSFGSFDTTVSGVSGIASPTFPDENYNLTAAVASCTASTGVNFFTDFTSQTRTHSWAATHKPSQNTTIILDSTYASATPVATNIAFNFPFYSIVSRVLVKKEAKFIPGFYVTDHLEFEDRTAADGEVTFVGFVAAAKVTIPLGAIRQGVRFFSATSPMGLQIARNMHWLGGRGVACESAFNPTGAHPVWATFPTIAALTAQVTCGAQQLMTNEIMRWTSAKPPCGLMADGTTTLCTGEVYHRNLIKISETVEGLR